MQFLLDENIPIGLLKWMELCGHNVERVPNGIKNGEVLALAKQKSSVLVTLDKDFTNRLMYPPAEFSGIVVLRIHPPTAENLQSAMSRFLSAIGSTTLSQKLFVVDLDDYHLFD